MSYTEDKLKQALKEVVGTLPENFTWHLHSMDVGNLIRTGIPAHGHFVWSTSMQDLLGHPIHVDDRYPRWLNITHNVLLGEKTISFNAQGMVEFSVFKSRETKKPIAWCHWCSRRKATHVVSCQAVGLDACDDPECHEENPGRPLTPNQRRVVVRTND